MNKEHQIAWENFARSGKVKNYLEYRQYMNRLHHEGIEDGVKASTRLNPVEKQDIESGNREDSLSEEIWKSAQKDL